MRGAPKFGTKVEAKNLNSFRYLAHALEYEIERQIGVIEAGGAVVQETRLWNVAAGRTEPMRSKEFAHDYRYFPDPDLLPLISTQALVEEIRRAMPELPDAKYARLVNVYGIAAYDAGVLTATRALADYFEAVVHAGAPAKAAASWISVELLRRLKDAGKQIADCPVAPAAHWRNCTGDCRTRRNCPACQQQKSSLRCSTAEKRPLTSSRRRGCLRFRIRARLKRLRAR